MQYRFFITHIDGIKNTSQVPLELLTSLTPKKGYDIIIEHGTNALSRLNFVSNRLIQCEDNVYTAGGLGQNLLFNSKLDLIDFNNNEQLYINLDIFSSGFSDKKLFSLLAKVTPLDKYFEVAVKSFKIRLANASNLVYVSHQLQKEYTYNLRTSLNFLLNSYFCLKLLHDKHPNNASINECQDYVGKFVKNYSNSYSVHASKFTGIRLMEQAIEQMYEKLHNYKRKTEIYMQECSYKIRYDKYYIKIMNFIASLGACTFFFLILFVNFILLIMVFLTKFAFNFAALFFKKP